MKMQGVYYREPSHVSLQPEQLIAVVPDEKQANAFIQNFVIEEFRRLAPMDSHPRTDVGNYLTFPIDVQGQLTVHVVTLFHEGYDYTTSEVIGIFGDTDAAQAAIDTNIAEERENWDVSEGNRNEHDVYIPALDRDNYSISTRVVTL